MIEKKTASKQLLRHRLDNDLTQAEVSQRSGVSIQTISGIESGKITPQTMTIFKLNQYFQSAGIE